MNETFLLSWWPVIGGFTAGLVWLVRLEAKVIAARTAIETGQQSNDAWRVAHAAEIVPQFRRIDESLERLERGQERLTEALGEVRERIGGVENALNGAHVVPKWDKTERRKR